MNNSSKNSGPGRADTRDFFRLHLAEVPAFRALLRGVESRLLSEVHMPEPVLDIGCGDGEFARVLANGKWLIGVDVWADGLREAYAREVYGAVSMASGTRLPLPDAFFATVVSNCVLEHIPDVDGVLREANRVLRPGGRLVITVPSHLFGEMLFGSTLFRRIGLRRLSRAYGDWFNRHSVHYHCDPPDAWRRRLERAGFRVDRWQYYMSAAAVRALDLAHYYGIPSLLLRKATGRWVLGRGSWNFALAERWLRKHYREPVPEQGGYIFIEATKLHGILAEERREGARQNVAVA